MHIWKDKKISPVSEPCIAREHSLVPDKYMYPGKLILFVQIFPGNPARSFNFNTYGIWSPGG